MHGTFHIAFIVLLNILVVVLAAWLFMHLLKETKGDSNLEHDTLEMLERRFTNGEINKKEFEEMKKNLVG